MIDSNYPSLNIPTDMDLIPSSLLYSSLLDSTSNHFGLYDFENQNNLNNTNVPDFHFNEINNVNNNNANISNGQYFNYIDDNYSLTSLNNQLTGSTLTPIETNTISSSVSTSSYDYHHQRPLSTNSLDSLDVTRSIDGCKRDLIKATLNFAIKSRRRSLGLGEIDLTQTKVQEPRPSSWTEEDDEKKMSRRERNRIAARKCRKNRKLKFLKLNKTMEKLDNENNNLKEQFSKLKRESEQLEDILGSHQSQCYLVSWSSQSNLNSTSSSSPQLSYQSSSQSLSSSISSLLSTSSSPSSAFINPSTTNYLDYSDKSLGFISYINQCQPGMLL